MLQAIEEKRRQLLDFSKDLNLTDPKVVKLSQELDILIFSYIQKNIEEDNQL